MVLLVVVGGLRVAVPVRRAVHHGDVAAAVAGERLAGEGRKHQAHQSHLRDQEIILSPTKIKNKQQKTMSKVKKWKAFIELSINQKTRFEYTLNV